MAAQGNHDRMFLTCYMDTFGYGGTMLTCSSMTTLALK